MHKIDIMINLMMAGYRLYSPKGCVLEYATDWKCYSIKDHIPVYNEMIVYSPFRYTNSKGQIQSAVTRAQWMSDYSVIVSDERVRVNAMVEDADLYSFAISSKEDK